MPSDYASQTGMKYRSLVEVWQRAGLVLPRAFDWVPAPASVGYRNRLRLRVTSDGQPTFFNPEKAQDCAVAEPSLLEAMATLSDWARRDRGALSAFSHLELRARDSDRRWGLRLVARAGAPASLLTAPPVGEDWLVAVTPALAEAVPSQRWLVTERVHVEVPLDAFMQVNSAVNRRLVAHVVAGVLGRGARSFADLFMGSGNFALPLLDAGLVGMGVEMHPGAVAAALRAARAQGLSGGFFAGSVGDQVADWLARGQTVDAVVCDPPRGGLGVVAPGVSRLARRWLVLCSCQPETLCRDLVGLVGCGFRVTSVTAFDMFPQTRHVEVVAWLERV